MYYSRDNLDLHLDLMGEAVEVCKTRRVTAAFRKPGVDVVKPFLHHLQ